VQDEDYRLALIEPSSGDRVVVSRAVGVGVSLVPLAEPIVAATEPTVPADAGGGPDQLTVYRLRDSRLEALWSSEPTQGSIFATAIGIVRGQLHLAAAERRSDGWRLHLYSNLPIPLP
jgi:hypothetical protein